MTLPAPFYIGQHKIGEGSPFVIAELSGNHNQDLDTALNMIEAAADAGVHAIKLQTYTADSMTLDVETPDFVISDEQSLWHGESLHALYQRAATPYEWHDTLFKHARSLGLEAFSSPFDEASVDFLDALEVPCFKIASFELTDLPLIAKAASKGKPLIMSTGMASIDEIDAAIQTAQQEGCQNLVLLKCTSTYPASPEDTNLLTIPDMRQRFGHFIGLSDHTRGIGVSIASAAFGACVIEKHLVLDRAKGGVDAEFSMEPQEFKALMSEIERAHSAIGAISYGGSENEQKSKQFRRSIFVSSDVRRGDTINEKNIKIVRPNVGLEPKYKYQVMGKIFNQDVSKGTPLDWSLFDD